VARHDTDESILLHTTPLDPLSQPVLRDLEREYDGRYGNRFGEPASTEINRYPLRSSARRAAPSCSSSETEKRSPPAPS
jgi:hypothetical protein